MPRKRTGSIIREGDHFIARILLDGKTERIHLSPKASAAKAKETAEFLSTNPAIARAKLAEQKAEKAGIVLPGKRETFAHYAARWLDDRDKRGFGHIQNDGYNLAKHINPRIGEKPIADVTKEDLERIVQVFDQQIARGEYMWTTVQKWWQTITKIFKDACTSKNVSLRVREDNPAANVAAPDTGDDRAKAFLYPDEFLRFASCELVDLKLRRIAALALYLYCRACEIVLLRWEDVDLEHGTVTICRSWDRERKREKATKSSVPRMFRIEPHILPLLRVLYAERDDSGRVLPATFHGLARRLRDGLRTAGITRADLFLADEKHIPLRFHDTRASAVTWMCMRGDSIPVVMQRVGHENFSTTQIYIRQAEALRGTVSDPFPPLPACLLGSTVTDGTKENPETNLSERTDKPTKTLWIKPTAKSLSSRGEGGAGKSLFSGSLLSTQHCAAMRSWRGGPGG